MVRNVPLTFTGVLLTKRKLGGEAEASPLFSLSARRDLIPSESAPWGRDGESRPSGGGLFLALTGGEDFSHDDGWCNAPPMSSEETPPLHFRLKPKIPLKLRSFLLSPPDPLRWAPAGTPPFLSAEKEKTGRARSKREKDFWNLRKCAPFSGAAEGI